MPTPSDETKSICIVPTVRTKIENVRTARLAEITRFVPPILATRGIKKALPAKHRTVKEVRNERAKELKLYCVFKIGINGLITVKLARMFMATKKIGRPLRIASLFASSEVGTL